MHHKNIHALAIEMFKVFTKTSPGITQEVFQIKAPGYYFLRNQRDFVIPTVKSVNYGLESIRFLGPNIWESLPNSMKNKSQLKVLKWLLRNGNQNHFLDVSVKHTCRT